MRRLYIGFSLEFESNSFSMSNRWFYLLPCQLMNMLNRLDPKCHLESGACTMWFQWHFLKSSSHWHCAISRSKSESCLLREAHPSANDWVNIRTCIPVYSTRISSGESEWVVFVPFTPACFPVLSLLCRSLLASSQHFLVLADMEHHLQSGTTTSMDSPT